MQTNSVKPEVKVIRRSPAVTVSAADLSKDELLKRQIARKKREDDAHTNDIVKTQLKKLSLETKGNWVQQFKAVLRADKEKRALTKGSKPLTTSLQGYPGATHIPYNHNSTKSPHHKKMYIRGLESKLGPNLRHNVAKYPEKSSKAGLWHLSEEQSNKAKILQKKFVRCTQTQILTALHLTDWHGGLARQRLMKSSNIRKIEKKFRGDDWLLNEKRKVTLAERKLKSAKLMKSNSKLCEFESLPKSQKSTKIKKTRLFSTSPSPPFSRVQQEREKQPSHNDNYDSISTPSAISNTIDKSKSLVPSTNNIAESKSEQNESSEIKTHSVDTSNQTFHHPSKNKDDAKYQNKVKKLFAAAQRGSLEDIQTIKSILDSSPEKIDVNEIREIWTRNTLLHVASQWNHPNIVRLLLKHGAKVDVKDRWKRNPLEISRQYDESHAKVTQILLQHRGGITNLRQQMKDSELLQSLNEQQSNIELWREMDHKIWQSGLDGDAGSRTLRRMRRSVRENRKKYTKQTQKKTRDQARDVTRKMRIAQDLFTQNLYREHKNL